MPNLRILHDNAADRATITASSTASGLPATNLQSDILGLVHRSVGTSVTYTLVWPTEEAVALVCIPACNLTAGATMRVRCYDAGDALMHDTGAVYAAPGAVLGEWDWSGPLAVNAFHPVPSNVNEFFAKGFGKAIVWLPLTIARKLVVDVSDPGNPAGFIDASRLVVGAYLQPYYNAGAGASVSFIDDSQTSIAASGDLRTDRGPRRASLQFDLGWIAEADRGRVARILRDCGRHGWMLISLYPQHGNPLTEQTGTIYGKLRDARPIAHNYAPLFSTSFDIEGW